MTLIQAKLLAAGTLLLIAVGYLGVTGVASGWVYFVDVDKFVVDAQLQKQRVRLHGKVGADAFSVSSAGLVANFRLVGATSELPVVYHGTIPEMFGVDKDVVVEGRMDGTGTFKADVLMTKCASKYEEGGSPHGEKTSEPKVGNKTATEAPSAAASAEVK